MKKKRKSPIQVLLKPFLIKAAIIKSKLEHNLAALSAHRLGLRRDHQLPNSFHHVIDLRAPPTSSPPFPSIKKEPLVKTFFLDL